MGKVVRQLVVWMVAVAAPAWAASSAEEILQMLGSPDYARRQAASDALLADRTLADDALVSLYGAARTREQRHRLLAVARHNLLRRARLARNHKKGEAGSIGIAHEGRISSSLPGLNRPAVMVVRTLPGFPAHERLRSGDLILAVDGHQLVENGRPAFLRQEFPVRIRSKKAGQTVRLSIFRNQRAFDVVLPLATGRALEEMYPQDIGYVLADPYRSQWMRLRARLEALEPPRRDLLNGESVGE